METTYGISNLKQDKGWNQNFNQLTPGFNSEIETLKSFEQTEPNENFDANEVFEDFKRLKFITSENWTSINSIPAKVVGFNTQYVTCDLLIDREELTFETRIFDKSLFDNINLDKVLFVKIKIRTKPGSLRIDISNGTKTIDQDLFNISSELETLNNFPNSPTFKYSIED